ncbi:TolC family protein [Crenobacter sp. SG2303]|uniref:TolC family protein n=1 Tax=Crenobacter oryzisoli TaxID=3056844 RepID=A0ABT7XNI6_9NEIS|nr:TolC family protein [Crenobacter sp. SG2303]MDN0075361.1 TolC family protein [Crenobacter sp. SG2303]
MQLRLAGGLATRREQALAEAQLAQTRASLPPLAIEREVQLNRLDVLMGATPGSYASELARPVERYTVPAIAASRGPAQLLRRRPDVIAAERRLAASNARIGAATAQYYPQLTLSALLGFVSLSSGQLLTAAAFQPQAAAGLRWRLFDFGRVDAEVAAAKGGEAEALARYRQSMLRATEDVENAIVTLTQLEAQGLELKVQVAAQTQARDTSEEAYRGGAVSLFEVLDEERRLLATRDQQAQVRAADARAAVATFRTLGGGW